MATITIKGTQYTLDKIYEAGTDRIEQAFNNETGERTMYCSMDMTDEQIIDAVSKVEPIRPVELAIKREVPEGFQHIKPECVLLVLYTDEDGRRLVGGCDIDSGRDWVDVFSDCAKEIVNSGRVVDVKAE